MTRKAMTHETLGICLCCGREIRLELMLDNFVNLTCRGKQINQPCERYGKKKENSDEICSADENCPLERENIVIERLKIREIVKKKILSLLEKGNAWVFLNRDIAFILSDWEKEYTIHGLVHKIDGEQILQLFRLERKVEIS